MSRILEGFFIIDNSVFPTTTTTLAAAKKGGAAAAMSKVRRTKSKRGTETAKEKASAKKSCIVNCNKIRHMQMFVLVVVVPSVERDEGDGGGTQREEKRAQHPGCGHRCLLQGLI
ncbi:hypothetical protein Trydic_g19876 [Trypoxylus dichotomus]